MAQFSSERTGTGETVMKTIQEIQDEMCKAAKDTGYTLGLLEALIAVKESYNVEEAKQKIIKLAETR